MKRDIFSYKIFVSIYLFVWLLFSGVESFGYTTGSNGWHLNSPFQAEANADLVCKVRVLSIRQEKVVKGNLYPGQRDLLCMIATSKVLSVVKGECPDVIHIEFQRLKSNNPMIGHLPGQLYTELSENEVCLVFLKESGHDFKLNRIYSKARVPPEIVDYNLGETPDLKLLAEFIAGCDSEDELVRLQAVEELGYLGDAMINKISSSPYRDSNEALQRCLKMNSGLSKAREEIMGMHSCQDVVMRSIAFVSSFQLDDSPCVEGLLELLRMKSSDFGPDDSLKKYGIRDFSISSLQLRLLETMDLTTRRVLVDLKDGSVVRREEGNPFRGVRGFDYADFYRQALDCKTVKGSEQMRTAIANVIWIRYERASVPEMIRLLDDPSMHIRSTAVSALRKCINSDRSNSWEPRHFYDPNAVREYMSSGIEKKLEDRQKDYRDNEQEYIRYWKKWWQEHKTEFKI